MSTAPADARRFRSILIATLSTVALFCGNAARAAVPTISGSPPTTVALKANYDYRPTARDSDGDKISFWIANRPAWASFDPANGRLYGQAKTAGTFSDIRIYARAGGQNSSPLTFAIKVGTTSGTTTGAPKISGTPASSVVVGNTYRFQPTASDPNGDTLGYTISNRPSWATFNTSTGLLTGQPTLANVGTFSNVTIRVSDGRTTVSLPAFSITVSQSSSGVASLSWTPPTRNTNGTTLSNLAGYRIYYGTSSTVLNKQIQIASAGIASYVVQNLAPGTYYFGVRAYTSTGSESSLSNVTSKTIR
jgi:hypothetical protein